MSSKTKDKGGSSKDRQGKTPEDLAEDVETMANKAGVELPEDEEEKHEEVRLGHKWAWCFSSSASGLCIT